jgi:hypothetical protein
MPYSIPMSKLKRPRDPNQLGKLIVDIATGESDAPKAPAEPTPSALYGREGGLKGGRARASKLSPERRSEIARNAARARWRKP